MGTKKIIASDIFISLRKHNKKCQAKVLNRTVTRNSDGKKHYHIKKHIFTKSPASHTTKSYKYTSPHLPPHDSSSSSSSSSSSCLSSSSSSSSCASSSYCPSSSSCASSSSSSSCASSSSSSSCASSSSSSTSRCEESTSVLEKRTRKVEKKINRESSSSECSWICESSESSDDECGGWDSTMIEKWIMNGDTKRY